MNIDQFSESRYLTKADCGKGILLTITKIAVQNVARQNESPNEKPVVFFAEIEKGLACNKVNREMIAHITGSRDTDHWVGHKVVLYDDPNIVYGSNVVGGIRVRAPRNQPAINQTTAAPRSSGKPAPPPVDDDGDDIPF